METQSADVIREAKHPIQRGERSPLLADSMQQGRSVEIPVSDESLSEEERRQKAELDREARILMEYYEEFRDLMNNPKDDVERALVSSGSGTRELQPASDGPQKPLRRTLCLLLLTGIVEIAVVITIVIVVKK